ncbi:MAG: formylglycine-generating enzyme family protein [Spirochaetaceae bacterium]|jgi:formylglycine-generating enzyme required for sulfatase activity|nr:formylglycine-generating enzyme family protein [Spirochaetaceae bacterium]
MNHSKKIAGAGLALLTVLCLTALGLAACSNLSVGPGGGGGFPAYTLKAIPAGTVNADTGSTGGPFAKAGTTAVSVSAFSIGRTEVTWELWNAVKTWAVGAKGYVFANPGRQGGASGTGPVGTNQHPVTTISWRDAVVWCNAYSEAMGKSPVYYLSGTSDFTDTTKVLRESESDTVSAGDGKAEQAVLNGGANGFRLPAEKEWEYAARGGVPGTSTPWTYTYAGSNDEDDVAVYGDGSTSSTAAVKSKTANTAELHDMSGNVWEWCQDVYSGTLRVFRGGGWGSGASGCTVSWRSSSSPGNRNGLLGFRVVCP